MHGLHIVHCDLKPGNIMCTLDPNTGKDVYKIIDFGGSLIAPENGTSRTDIIYTQEYAAPEIQAKKTIRPRRRYVVVWGYLI